MSRAVSEQFKLRQDVFVAELRLEPLLAAMERALAARQFVPVPRFPAVERDFSLVLSSGVAFADVQRAIKSLGIAEIRSVVPADRFEGGKIPQGKYSLMIRVTFESENATFTEAQLSDFSSRIVGALEKQLGATLRAS